MDAESKERGRDYLAADIFLTAARLGCRLVHLWRATAVLRSDRPLPSQTHQASAIVSLASTLAPSAAPRRSEWASFWRLTHLGL